jgi:hypothetical protein
VAATTPLWLIISWHLPALCRTMIDVQLAMARMR